MLLRLVSRFSSVARVWKLMVFAAPAGGEGEGTSSDENGNGGVIMTERRS